MNKHMGFGLNIIALCLFFPGVLLPMFQLNMEMAANISSSSFVSPLIDKELSIIATVTELWDDNRVLVAILIFLFSVCIPLSKTFIVSLAYFQRNPNKEQKLIAFVSNIGKWSMADVFVVAIFLAMLSTNHAETVNRQELSVFGFSFGVEFSSQTLSAVGQGFYFFAAYCLISLAGTHLYLRNTNRLSPVGETNSHTNVG